MPVEQLSFRDAGSHQLSDETKTDEMHERSLSSFFFFCFALNTAFFCTCCDQFQTILEICNTHALEHQNSSRSFSFKTM